MKYIFENENALEIYCTITKDMEIKMCPKGFNNEVYISERFMNECLADIHRQKISKNK